MKTKTLLSVFAIVSLLAIQSAAQVTVETVFTNDLREPYNVISDANNNFYISDSAHNRIIAVNPNTGDATVLAGYEGLPGSDDGPAYIAKFSTPEGMDFATIGTTNGIILADNRNHTIRFINLANGETVTLAGHPGISGPSGSGTGAGVYFRFPAGVAVSASSSNCYIADVKNHRIRVMSLTSPFNVSDLSLNNTSLYEPSAVAVAGTNQLWVADTGNHTVKLITLSSPDAGTMTSYIGSNSRYVSGDNDSLFGQSARFSRPSGLLFLGGNAGLLIADTGNNSIRVATNNPAFGTNNYSVRTYAGVPSAGGTCTRTDGPALTAKFCQPVGMSRDLLGSGIFVADLANNSIRRIQTGPALPPVTSPSIGWVDFILNGFGQTVSVLRTAQPFVFNNEVTIAILAEAGTETFYTFGPTPPSPLEDTIPAPNRTSGATPPPYEDGMFPSQVPASIIVPQPDVTIKAISMQDGRRNSAITQARFQFKTANTVVQGDNAALFTLVNETVGAEMWYTVDGSTPTNNAPSIGPRTDGNQVSLILNGSNVTFKVRAFKANFKPSDVVTKVFSPTNFVPNRLTFGFENGEASSEFVASAGQNFYAPVTLSVIPGASMYTLQFNLTVTNVGASPAVTPGAVTFASMLQDAVPFSLGEKLPPGSAIWYRTIPPYADIDTNLVLVPPDRIVPRSPLDPQPMFNTMFTNSANNLLGVGWITRWGNISLYNTFVQDLIQFSIARDTLFRKQDGRVVVGAYRFQVPASASGDNSYTIQLGRPSATSDGVGGPGSDVFIDIPTNGPIAAVKTVTVGARRYLVGDAAPFRWLNAGDFGNGYLVNSDVIQVFESAVLNYAPNDPPSDSDLFDAMDSCCASGVTNGATVYQIGGAVLPLTPRDPIYDGSDPAINFYPFGDGSLDISDVYVTFRRSLDPTLTWWNRFHTTNGLAAEATTNLTSGGATVASGGGVGGGSGGDSDANRPAVKFVAGDLVGAAGTTVQIPVTARIRGDYPLRLLMLAFTVHALDGSPEILDQVTFTPAAGLGQPGMTRSFNVRNYSAAWLNRNIAGFTEDAVIGTLSVRIPSGASTDSAYAIHFNHASASHNGTASWRKDTTTGLITTRDRSTSSLNDGIPDSWRLRYFGTLHNALSAATADADGDSANNKLEFLAGTNPNDGGSILRLASVKGPTPDFVIRWPSVSGKNYVIERSPAVFGGAWLPIATVPGNGWDMEFQEPMSSGAIRFYRIRIAP